MTTELVLPLEQIPAVIEAERQALATIIDVNEADLVVRRAGAIAELTRRAGLAVPVQNAATLLQLDAQARLGVLVAEGQERGEIATPGGDRTNVRDPNVATFKELGLKAPRVSEGKLLAETGVVEVIRAAVEKDPAKPISRDRALRIARDERAKGKREAEVERAAALPPSQEHDLHHCAAIDLKAHIDPGSVGLILTDPPYPREHLSAWDELADLAAHALSATGILVAYSGQLHLPEVLTRLSARLQYVWTGALYTPGPAIAVRGRPLQSSWKPVLFYMRTDAQPSKYEPRFHDVVVSEQALRTKDENERVDHKWQQAIVPVREWITRLSKKDTLVCDPFLGSGTTAVAAQQTGRPFVGCDKDMDAVLTTKVRLADDAET